ncbi:MAG TPA: hypothetical protein VKM55_19215 [Candidatus Lokiarchaeia archaeon]|nr:hypothetical protein [Candidatus Lokiarchaeia archaeon]
MSFHVSKVMQKEKQSEIVAIREEKQDEIVTVVDSQMKPLGNDSCELCPECREASVFLDIERGFIVCRNCGCVKGEMTELPKKKLGNDAMGTHAWGSF